MPDLPQPGSYNRFDPLNDELDPSQLPAVRETEAGDNAVAATGSGQSTREAGTASGPIFDSEELTASEAEERRAGQLLDRAFALWEKDDSAGAILACRQSLTLSPQSAPAHSMLGLLLEKTGDTAGAIAAYEKAVEIEPSSLLERDSARRLRAGLGQALPTQFHFQEAELFDPIETETRVDLAPSAGGAVAPTSGSNLPVNSSAAAPVAPASGAPSSTRLDASPASGVVTNVAPTVVSSAVAASANPAPITATQTTTVRMSDAPTQTASTQIPVPADARPMQAVSQTTVAPTAVPSGASKPENISRATTTATSATVAPATASPAVIAPVATPPVVQTGAASSASGAPSRLDGMAGSLSTFWTRSLPLMALAGTGFLFLLWSRDIASERERRTAQATSTTIINNTAPAAPLDNANGASDTENGAVVANGATSLTNSVTTNNLTTNSATASGATASGATANGTASNAAPGAVSDTTGAATSNTAPTDANAAIGGANAQSSTQSPTTEPRIAPSGLIVSNAPVVTRRASAPSAERASSSRNDAPRTFRRRAESTRTRRASRSEEDRPARRSRAAYSDVAANNSRSNVSQQPEARFIPPAPVTQLPRAQESAPRLERETGVALPPMPPSASTSDNGASRSEAGPLPSFPSPSLPAPSQVESRTQNEMRPRPSSPARSQTSTGLGETAYQYQSRALIYVGQGDNARAADDFQSAITLYRRQIARGENVAEARRGLEACQKGLRLISVS